MSSKPALVTKDDFRVANLSLADWGREEFGKSQPLKGARIAGGLHLKLIGIELTTLTQQKADYLHAPVEGPSKPDHYRY